jgi:hypothetical protein
VRDASTAVAQPVRQNRCASTPSRKSWMAIRAIDRFAGRNDTTQHKLERADAFGRQCSHVVVIPVFLLFSSGAHLGFLVHSN